MRKSKQARPLKMGTVKASSEWTCDDLTNYWLLDHDSVGHPTAHSLALELFRDSVIRPSLSAVNEQIATNERSPDREAVFFHDDLAALHHATVESFLLTLQAMFERALRGMLIERGKSLTAVVQREAIEAASWHVLHEHFLRLFGLPLDCFDSHGDLDLLQNLGSAIRHGDGPAAKRVHKLAPSLWTMWLEPGTSFQAGTLLIVSSPSAPAHPQYQHITLPESLLDQMMQSVMAFWEDIENLRCNSFTRKHVTVKRQLAEWNARRERRQAQRVWPEGRFAVGSVDPDL